jgi:hypothetical protein
MCNLQEFMSTQPQASSAGKLLATIRTERGERVTLSFKDTPLSEVRERVARAARAKFPYRFTFTVREA